MAEWRRLYKQDWQAGAERVNSVRNMMEAWECGLIIKLGFMATSTQHLVVTPDEHESGEPDLEVWQKDKHIANVEVTGSWIDIGRKDLFLRPDKVAWAFRHPVPITFAWFVYKDNEFIFSSVRAGKYPIEVMDFRGRCERYHVIPQAVTISPELLKGYLCKLK